jgi:hypothetical protein
VGFDDVVDDLEDGVLLRWRELLDQMKAVEDLPALRSAGLAVCLAEELVRRSLEGAGEFDDLLDSKATIPTLDLREGGLRSTKQAGELGLREAVLLPQGAHACSDVAVGDHADLGRLGHPILLRGAV